MASLVFLLDEFHRLATRESARWMADRSELLIFELARILRKRGGGILIGDQLPSFLPAQVVGLTNTKLVFRLSSGGDIRTIAESMSLEPEQARYLTELPLRRAVVFCPALHPHAFLIQVPDLDFSRRATAEEIEERMSVSVEGLDWSESERWEEPDEPAQEKQASLGSASFEALNYLKDVAQRPFVPAGKRDASLRVSSWKGNRLRSELYDAGLVKFHQLRTGRRGGIFLLAEITDAGYQRLEELKVKPAEVRGKGSFLHQAAQHYLAEFWRKARPGARVEIEDGSSGKSVDVSVTNGEQIAIEILVSGVNKEIRNVEADLRSYSKVILVSDSPEQLRELREKITSLFSEEERARISFRLLAGYLEGFESDSRKERKGN